ncbi:unnamed protein product [Sphagnum troendelagicum]|uniref:Uncharacterized protein n=1 Tax=Sphagnum troendelagicum TaxID=128251 RepID=A0ABP0UH35_9BRYO
MGGISSSIVAWTPKELTTGRQAGRLMTQLGNAWLELARSVRDSFLTMPQALPQMVREKIKGLYQSFEKGVA